MFFKDNAKLLGLLLVLDCCLLYAPPKQDKAVQQAKGKVGTSTKKAKSFKSAKGQDEEDRLLEEALAKAQEAHAVESQARDDAAQFQELFKAIDLNNSMQVKKLIDQNSRLVSMRNELGSTALMFASNKGNTDIVRLLLDAGAALDLQNNVGTTALMSASFERNIDIMRMLLDRKANIGLRNKEGFTALTISAYHGNADMVRMLLENGADPNVPQIKGMTALMFAAYFVKADVVRLLLEAGANPALQDDAGYTALMIAENQSKKIETASSLDIVKMLKEAMLEEVVLKQDEATVSAPGIVKMLKETLLKQCETIVKILKEAMLKQDMEHTLKDKEHTLEEENLAAVDLFNTEAKAFRNFSDEVSRLRENLPVLTNRWADEWTKEDEEEERKFVQAKALTRKKIQDEAQSRAQILEDEDRAAHDLFNNAEEEAFRNLDPIERLRKELPKIGNWADEWDDEEDVQRFLHR